MTDKEIIKALECCTHSKWGDKCAECFYCECDSEKGCQRELTEDALDLINRQQAEIERLTINMNAFGLGMKQEKERADTIKAEAIKEFAERLKAAPMRFLVEYVKYYDKPSIDKMVLFIDDNDIDNLVKEMVGEQE